MFLPYSESALDEKEIEAFKGRPLVASCEMYSEYEFP